ncbi:hypothetical protein C7212DRAFT_357241 [Tuber magnatum]|uniref:C2H2-type domain-containing protein n=1 Tax=Tuber magnatum TaxID=42249 RepID=A0A317SRS1_9PEZI|nr:hypothetical protein C7212DRAFT_357241 [Tuber magnatum]
MSVAIPCIHNFPEGNTNLHPSQQISGDPGTHDHSDRSPEPRLAIFPNTGGSPITLELSSRSGSRDSDGGIETNRSGAINCGNIDAFTQDGSPSSYPNSFATADCDLGSDPLICHICAIRFSRQADLKRHLGTSKVHASPKGPKCPMPGCRGVKRFTRLDNFKAHYVKMHGINRDEADAFIREWRARGGRGME